MRKSSHGGFLAPESQTPTAKDLPITDEGPEEKKPPKKKESQDLLQLSDSAMWQPTPAQRQLKSKFWLRVQDNPLVDQNNVSLELIRQVTGTGSAAEHWSKPGFREWFLNQDEHREKLEHLFGLALDAAQQILLSDDPKLQGARVNTIKVVAELARKFPSRGAEVDPHKDAINKMSREELEDFLQKNGLSIEKRTSLILDLPAGDNKK